MMRIRPVEDGDFRLFRRYEPGAPLSACIGLDAHSGEPIRVAFDAAGGGNIMIVGRSREAALGICMVALLDLATQITSTPGQREIYTTPPFSIMDFVSTEESRVFADAAMSLPLPVKLERDTISEMTSLGDFQYALLQRDRHPEAPRHAKFLFICGFHAAHGMRSRGSYAPDTTTPNAARLARILRDGTAHSLFAVVWCNTFANLDLTRPEGLADFDHVIVLDGAGDPPPDLPAEPGENAWYINRRTRSATPITPLALPPESWSDAVIRSFV
ncbi:hypothetical protein [Acrocarpospora corrugata]|uniref:hypothetical protein n=1 Tax=Acrocarpospora corrugata TaxID=35763 RepID=UPI0012D2A654|nr:hypothetical protein [Acrocarpospora corrugata]